METRAAIGPIGVWSREFRNDDPSAAGVLRDAAAELEALGYGAVWIGGSPGTAAARPLLDATTRLVVATGILSVWEHDAAEVAAETAALDEHYQHRFVLGLGVSHGHIVTGYEKPYAKMVDYLDALDTTGMAAERRVLAALGPKMLRLAAERSAGAHPYMAPLAHTVTARATLGAGPLLAPEVNVVLEREPEVARAAARAHVKPYLELMPNYTNNMRRYGFTDDDIRDGGSDRLIDSLYLWGDEERIRERVAEFHAAGADHLAIQVVRAAPDDSPPMSEYRRLAAALI
ncbi:TIGR03620 family F420-dependent LLM class oxidoreductase [Asanoa sp. NPDC049573]|uniref:TIGR03620 family F420-dependent LLM class oxidoreductase n=1 Tax=Asanoa sp. NPDC049573 TaxID=3155396 RepID=UPI00341D5862